MKTLLGTMAFVAGSSLIASGSASAALMETLNPAQDGGIHQTFPNAKSNGAGIGTALASGATRVAYFQFNLGAISPADVTSATLILDFEGSDASGTTGVWGYTDGGATETFDETALNWNTASANGDVNESGDILNGAYLGDLDESGEADGDDWSILVTSFVQSDTNGIVTFVVRSNSGATTTFASKENTEFEAPRLVVEYVPEPASLALLGLGGLALLRRQRA